VRLKRGGRSEEKISCGALMARKSGNAEKNCWRRETIGGGIAKRSA